MTATRWPTRAASAALLAAEEVDGVLLTGYFGGYSTGTTT